MKTIQTLEASGTLIARQPLAVSPPGAAWKGDKDSKQPPPSRLPSMGRGTAAARYIPASTMRHVIRYGIALVVQAALMEQSRSLSLDQLLALDKGFAQQKKSTKSNGRKKSADFGAGEAGETANAQDGATGAAEANASAKKKAHEVLQDEIATRTHNPLLSLLGMWGVPSELRVRNVMPIKSEDGENVYCLASGLTRKELEHDLVRSLSEEDRGIYLNKLDGWSDKNKDSTGLKHHAEASWEEIIAGTQCDWGYMIHRTDPVKSGAVLAALRAFAGDPVIGAHRAVGRGEVEINLHAKQVHQDILRGPTTTEIGAVHVARGVFEVTGALADDLRAFDEAARAGFPGMDFSIIPSSNPESAA